MKNTTSLGLQPHPLPHVAQKSYRYHLTVYPQNHKLKVPISSKFLFSYLILYITQETSAKEKCNLDKM